MKKEKNMSKVVFTMEQQQAIDAREREILVAAAAGSGKTAVLVERIITLVLNEHVDITKLVILTFTNAAAAQMRRRLRERLQTLIPSVNTSDREFLQKQILLLPVAHISTFHAYCIAVLRNYYQFADLSPKFKIIEENALALLKEEALAQTIEQVLAERAQHEDVLDYFVIGNKLHRLETIITEIYEKTRAYAFVDTWMKQAIGFTSDEAMIEQLIEAFIVAYYKQVNVWLRQFHQMEHDLLNFPKNQAVIVQLIVALKQFSMIPYEASIMQLRALQFPKWPSIKKDEATPESAQAHALFNKLKKEIKQYGEQHATREEMVQEQRALAPIVRKLLRFVKLYERNLAALKKAQDVIDFADVEHKMVELLHGHEPLRHELAENITEILVDEYQDTNELQDTILQLLKNETNRLFMVGDIKQSIYRFRLADPTIFLTKKERYQATSAANEQRLIILNKNFRSSANILTTVNTIFTSLFKLDIQYPAEEQLYLGEGSATNQRSHYTKWHFFTEHGQNDTVQLQTVAEKKATAIVNEIVRLVSDEQIYDATTNSYRAIRLQDIALLFRSRNSQVIRYIEQKLEEAQIHYNLENDKGYFDAVEVSVSLALLNTLENPYNSIALIAYLRSPMCAINDEELMFVAEHYRKSQMPPTDKFYEYVRYYKDTCDDELASRLHSILDNLSQFRAQLTVMGLAQALEAMYEKTNYYNFVATLPHGNIRQLNLDILVNLARTHEVRGKHSLLSFNKYIRALQQNKRDFSVAKPKGKAEDTLSLMTIHKAKGLEFPVVFLVDLDKQFNEQDTRMNYQLSKQYGLALQYHDLEQHIRYKTKHYQFIAEQTTFEMKAEELRVLYVALTRPKQQLHIFLEESDQLKQLDTSADILTLRSYGEALRAVYARAHGERTKWQRTDISLKSIIKSAALLAQTPLDASVGTSASSLGRTELQTMKRKMKLAYKYHNFSHYKQKYTVSELKDRRLAREVGPLDLRDGLVVERAQQVSPKLYEETPQFMKKDGLSVLERGTLYHLILEHYPWTDMPTVQAHLKAMVLDSLITEDELVHLQPEKLYKTVQDVQADYLAKGFEIVAQELPFAFTHEAKALYSDPLLTDERLLIQGKIDMLLRKGRSYVIIDFKTDALGDGQSVDTLNKRYENQLFFYREAVRRGYAASDVQTKIYAIFG
jgi:ATP-dependent helicase/nuclease subunit A